MKFNPMMMTLLLFATLAGCASIDLDTEGGGNSPLHAMEADSQGGDSE